MLKQILVCVRMKNSQMWRKIFLFKYQRWPTFACWSHCASYFLCPGPPGRLLIQCVWFQHIFRMTPRLSRTASLCCGVSWVVDNLAGATFSLALCSLRLSLHPVVTLTGEDGAAAEALCLFYDRLTAHYIYLYDC